MFAIRQSSLCSTRQIREVLRLLVVVPPRVQQWLPYVISTLPRRRARRSSDRDSSDAFLARPKTKSQHIRKSPTGHRLQLLLFDRCQLMQVELGHELNHNNRRPNSNPPPLDLQHKTLPKMDPSRETRYLHCPYGKRTPRSSEGGRNPCPKIPLPQFPPCYSRRTSQSAA